MRVGPDISRIAALIGDPARSAMLLALMDGRALTASELAGEAAITKQTASAHLAKLVDGRLLLCEIQGRHRYFRLFDNDVAHAIEALIGVAHQHLGQRTRTGPSDPSLRQARVCYDHVAGDAGVYLFDRLLALTWLTEEAHDLVLTDVGRRRLVAFGVPLRSLEASRRPLCRTCLDWSARRRHLAGGLGAALLDRFLVQAWLKRLPSSRVLAFTPAGQRHWRAWLK